MLPAALVSLPNAMTAPSGDQAGYSSPGSVVSWCRPVPSDLIVWMPLSSEPSRSLPADAEADPNIRDVSTPENANLEPSGD